MSEASLRFWIKWGYSARGAVYCTVGVLALMAALDVGGETTDSRGAIRQIAALPLGNGLLILLVIGLLGYVIWRLMQAVKDVDGHGTSGKGLVIRSALFVSALTHALLALFTVKLLTGDSDSSNNEVAQGLLATAWGPWLLLITGVVFVIVGVAHVYKGWTARFERYMSLPSTCLFWARPLCRFGLAARGVVWLIVGSFFLQTAQQARSDHISNMADALQSLQSSSMGPWFLILVSVGLIAFGVYSFFESVYRRVDTRALGNDR